MMRNSTLFILFAFVAIISFSSCKKDEFLDWKFMNKQWLAEHQNDKGFTTTASGVQYRVINEGFTKPGTLVKSEKYIVEVILEGHFITGEKDFFEPKRQSSNSVSAFPKGLREVLKMMHQDATYEVRIPQEMGFGDKKERSIPPYSTLIYKVTLKGAHT